MRIILRSLIMLLPLPCLLPGQSWEVGAAGGFGVVRDVSVTANSVTGKAGFSSGFAAGVTLGNQLHRYIGGEARYTYRDSDLRVSSGSTKVTARAESHALHYDVLIHVTSREALVRPFFAAGAGIKYFRGTGAEPAFQPLGNLVLLTRTTEVKPLISAGGGVKVRAGKRALVRFDFRDYATPVPTSLLATPDTARIHGWIHDFVLLVGVSTVF